MDYELEWDEMEQEELERERERRERRRRMLAQRRQKNKRLRLIYGLIRFFGPYAAGAVVLITAIAVGVNALSQKDNAEEGKNRQIVQENEEASKGEQAETANQPASVVSGEGENGNTGGITGNTGGETGNTGDITENTGGENGQNSGDAGNNANAGKTYRAQTTSATRQLGEEIDSSYAILIDMETGNILAEKDGHAIINPASMTKILTILVAAEHVTDLDDTFTITLNETDYSYINDCSNVGFLENEVVTVRDLFYGTILPSGGDAAAGLAAYVAGTREAFVDLMNEKLKELGLADTAHFTNCVGLYDEEHYCTVYDMAMILEAAMDNEICREALTAHTYTTSPTAQHPEGILISNWFLRRIEDKDTGGEVLYAKTGFVNQSGSCAASYQLSNNNKGYLCVTAQAGSSWRCIYDHVALYKEYSE